MKHAMPCLSLSLDLLDRDQRSMRKKVNNAEIRDEPGRRHAGVPECATGTTTSLLMKHLVLFHLAGDWVNISAESWLGQLGELGSWGQQWNNDCLVAGQHFTNKSITAPC